VDGQYQLLPPGKDGIWRSQVFPGLWLNGQAFLAGDMQSVVARLQEGLLAEEHKAFAAALASHRKLHGVR
jgi:hypothetical protein